jgi:hypothetical protein
MARVVLGLKDGSILPLHFGIGEGARILFMQEQHLTNRAKIFGWVIGIALVLAVTAWKHFIH